MDRPCAELAKPANRPRFTALPGSLRSDNSLLCGAPFRGPSDASLLVVLEVAMITVRKAADCGHEHGWLDSWHTFSFGDYYDPQHMGPFLCLLRPCDQRGPRGGRERVSDLPASRHGSLTYVPRRRARTHKWTSMMGRNGSVMRSGDVQRRTAGTGVAHSEFNGSRDNAVHFLQIWILPESRNLQPGLRAEELHRARPPSGNSRS